MENYEEDSFEIEEDEDEEDEDLLDQQQLMATKESTPSETGKKKRHSSGGIFNC